MGKKQIEVGDKYKIVYSPNSTEIISTDCFGGLKLNLKYTISSIQVLSHLNCYSVCELVLNMGNDESIPSEKSILGVVSQMSEAIGKRFSVAVGNMDAFCGLMTSVEYILRGQVKYAVPTTGYGEVQKSGSKKAEPNMPCIKVTLVSSIQRLENIWRPRSWMNNLTDSQQNQDQAKAEEAAEKGGGSKGDGGNSGSDGDQAKPTGVTILGDGVAELKLEDVISSLLGLSNEVTFDPDSDFANDARGVGIRFNYALWPSYMNAFDYLVTLVEAAGVSFHVTPQDRVIFGHSDTVVSVGNSALACDIVSDSFTFINSASAYSHGARTNTIIKPDEIGIKKRRFVEGRVSEESDHTLEMEGNARLDRYMDVIAGTSKDSATMKLNSAIYNEVRSLGLMNFVCNVAGEYVQTTDIIMSKWPIIKQEDLWHGAFSVTSYCYLVGECIDVGGSEKRGRLYVTANEIEPKLSESKGGSESEGDSESGIRLHYDLHPAADNK